MGLLKIGTKNKEMDQDVNINITPLVDCFSGLMTYLLVAASFISLLVIEASIAGEGLSEANSNIKVSLEMRLKPNKNLSFILTGEENKQLDVPSTLSGEWNMESVMFALEKFKSNYPTIDSVIVSAENEVLYKDIVKIVDASKDFLPVVFIGGVKF